jgi:hypothetical protein
MHCNIDLLAMLACCSILRSAQLERQQQVLLLLLLLLCQASLGQHCPPLLRQLQHPVPIAAPSAGWWL